MTQNKTTSIIIALGFLHWFLLNEQYVISVAKGLSFKTINKV